MRVLGNNQSLSQSEQGGMATSRKSGCLRSHSNEETTLELSMMYHSLNICAVIPSNIIELYISSAFIFMVVSLKDR